MSEFTIKEAKPSKWRCILNGNGTDNSVIYFLPADGVPPNWFHRFMHRIAFGFKWERVGK